MEKISTGIAYGTSAGSAGYWFLQWLDQVSPSQWAAIGVLGSLLLGLLTYLTNLYFKSGASDLSDESVFQNKRR
ncbi:lysis protein S [Shigella sonnei]|nr:lysis protein S [Shigella sonnei]CSP32974.1 lysis protein S [Shigella sonnei]CSP64000.1 lysis protein S [Shigella sonnei]CSP72923.1 lysis protein S [Shigella sonnei]CSP81728.1 lysis protein S [Shigella sonnei]